MMRISALESSVKNLRNYLTGEKKAKHKSWVAAEAAKC